MYRRVGTAICAATLLWGSSALAVQPLEIKGVIVDVDPATGQTELRITGENFQNGSDLELWLGEGNLLTIVDGTLVDTFVIATVPPNVVSGSYQLIATTGGGTVRFDDFDGVTIGAAGPQGPEGPPGVDGEDGIDGSPGGPGPKGEPGPAGPAGADGNDGAQGIRGEQGPKGDTGPEGPQGPAGDNGVDGAPGSPGADGQDGANCYDGIGGTSVDDCIGPKGDKGDTGEQGPTGDGTRSAAFEIVLEPEASDLLVVSVSDDLRPQLEEFCGDIDACTIRIVSMKKGLPTHTWVEEWQFYIRPDPSNGSAHWGVHGTWRWSDTDQQLANGVRGEDGNGLTENAESVNGLCDFGDTEIVEVNPGEYSASDNQPGMYFSATNDHICRLWIFD